MLPKTADYAIVQGMVNGSIQGLEPLDYFLFVETGLAHLLAASGSHLIVVAILAQLGVRSIQLLLRCGGAERFAVVLEHPVGTASVVAFSAATFAWLTDFSKPLTRALAALFIVLVGRAWGAQIRAPAVIFVGAAAAILWGRGGMLSLTLSLAAVLGILYPPRFLRRRNLWLRIAMAPCLATFPLIAAVFHQGSLASPVHNLLFAGLWSFLPLPLGIAAKLAEHSSFSNLATFLLDAAAVSVHFLCRGMQELVLILPSAVAVPFFPWLSATFFGYFAWLACRRRPNRFALLSGYWLSAFLIYQFLWPSALALCLNVGQGDALLVRTERGALPFLIDLGPGKRGPMGGVVQHALAREGIGRIRGILLTHLDADHSGALPAVLARYAHKDLNFWFSCASLPRQKGLDEIRLLERFGIIPNCIGTTPLEIYPGLVCVHHGRGSGSNEDSPLCRFASGGISLAMAGDSNAQAEEIYSELYPEMLQAQVWKVSHHGSKNSSSHAFLNQLTSERVWISAGLNNSYGHPHILTLQRLRTHAFRVERTDHEGTLRHFPKRWFGSWPIHDHQGNFLPNPRYQRL